MNRKEFDNILSECLEQLLERGGTVEQCLARYPEQAAELAPLLETALSAKKASSITPDPEFRARARCEFQSALQRMPVRETPARRLFMPRWATAVAAAMVVLLGSGGTVAAAADSMPDELLYPVKLATEQAWLAFTPSDVGKAEVYARLADRRVSEIAALASEGKAEQLGETTRRLDYDLGMVVVLAGGQVPAAGDFEERADGKPGEAPMLTATTTPVPTPTPVPTATPETQSGAKVEGGQRNYVALTGGEWGELGTTVGEDAASNLAKLRALLETAPASVRQALLQAIAVAEAGYQQALEAVTSQ